MKTIIFTLFIVLAYSLHSYGECGSWLISNEIHSSNIFSKLQSLPKKGSYLSIGADRAYLGATMAREAGINIQKLIRIDQSREVLEFGDKIPKLIENAQSGEELYTMAMELAKVENSYKPRKWLQYYLFGRLGFSYNFYQNDSLFNSLKARPLDSISIQIDLGIRSTWGPLFEELKHHNNIAVIDISNVQQYLHRNKLLAFMDELNTFITDETLIVYTSFMSLMHVATAAENFDNFYLKLKHYPRWMIRKGIRVFI